MAAGKGNVERVRRGLRTIFFMLNLVASLLVFSAPVLVAVADILVACALFSAFACLNCHSLKEHFERYNFGTSLVDIPIISVIRSIVVTYVYSLCDGPGLSHGPYLGTSTLCSSSSIIILSVKAFVFSAAAEIETDASTSLTKQKLHLKKSWGMPVMFLSSLVFALGHAVVAYRTSCRARRKLLFHSVDPEAVLACKNAFSSYQKVPTSPTPSTGKSSKSDSDTKRKPTLTFREGGGLHIRLLADNDSLFMTCQGLTLHYKLSLSEPTLSRSLASTTLLESKSIYSPRIMPGRLKLDRPPLTVPSKTHHQNFHRSFSNQFHSSSLYAPLLAGPTTPPTYLSDEIPVLSLDDGDREVSLSSNYLDLLNSESSEGHGRCGVVLVHGFGGGVFSWRHVMGLLARQANCMVVAFDRPGWGLTSRPRRIDWEDKQLPNPYELESQVDVLLSFCSELGLSSVVLVGHDDGGLLALKAAERVRASANSFNVKIKGVVVVSVDLSREVVPAFARILLHTSLGKKHIIRPLLRTEIIQVVNRRAWYDGTKLTTEVLNLYKAPLCVEGWDEALHEIGRLSFAHVLSSQNAALLLKAVEDLPVLVVTGAEDALVSLKSVQAMASKLANSDVWDSINKNDYFSMEGLGDFIKQLRIYKTPDLETPNYQILKRTASYEVRRYASFVVVETKGDKLAGSAGFNAVAGYIFGKNSSLEKIPMTTPVFTEALDDELSTVSLQIVLPLNRELDNLPDPSQESVSLRRVDGGIVAALKFSGKPTEDTVCNKEKTLRSALLRDNLKPKEGCMLARYNDPGRTRSFMMRNEVLIWLEDFSLD